LADNLLPFFMEHNKLLAGYFYFSLKFKSVNNLRVKIEIPHRRVEITTEIKKEKTRWIVQNL